MGRPRRCRNRTTGPVLVGPARQSRLPDPGRAGQRARVRRDQRQAGPARAAAPRHRRRRPGPALCRPVRLVVRRPMSRHRSSVARCTTTGRSPRHRPSEFRGQCCGGVDHQQVARSQVVGQIAERRVGDPVGAGDQQPHPVPAQPTVLRRLGRGQVLGCGEDCRWRRQGRGHRLTSTAAAGSDPASASTGGPSATATPSPARYRPLGGRLGDQVQQARAPLGGGAPVADVLAGEGGLLHAGSACRRDRWRSRRCRGSPRRR